MGTRMVRLDEELYKRIEARKREDETFSEAIERLVGGPSLLSLRGILSDDEAEQFREAVEDVDASATADVSELAQRFEDE